MFNKIFVLFIVNYFKLNIIYCDQKIVFSDRRYFEGDYCNRQIDDASGECKLITYCPKALEIYRKYSITPDVCEFKYNLPVVCCSEANLYYDQDYIEINRNLQNKQSNDGISLRKCREYEKIGSNIENYQQNEFIKSRIDLPHLATIGWTTNKYIDWKCDGSLISKNFILTSAGCLALNNVIPDLVKFLAQEQQATPENLNLFRITEIVNYPEYERNSFYDDLALIRIYENVRFGINIRPACLWQTNDINSTSVLFSKWSQIIGPTNEVVQQYVHILERNYCAQNFNRNEKLKYGISTNQICTGVYYRTSNNNCEGFSGGTIQIFFFKNGRKQFYIMGVGSSEVSCARGAPLVHARISSYIQWIERIVWPNNN